MSIRINDVSYSYRKKSAPAINALSCTIEPGIIGLIGPNGAGKSTLLRLIAGYLQPTSGQISIDDRSPRELQLVGSIGLIPESACFDAWLTVGEFLQMLAAMIGVEAVDAPHAIRDKRLGDLSQGQRRKVELLAATINTPLLLLLDEPTNGLDPDATRSLREQLTRYRAPDRYVIVSSHHLDELQRTADQVVFIREGGAEGVWKTSDIVQRFGSFDDFFATQSTAEFAT